MQLPHRLGADRRAHQMDVDHQPEIVEAHLGEALVAQDAGIVDEDVDAAPVVQRAADHRGDAASSVTDAANGDRDPACRVDLRRDGVGRLARQVVDDDPRALAREEQRVLAAEAAARARDDRHAVLDGMRYRHCGTSAGSGGEARPTFQCHGMRPAARRRHTTCSSSSYMPGIRCVFGRGASSNAM